MDVYLYLYVYTGRAWAPGSATGLRASNLTFPLNDLNKKISNKALVGCTHKHWYTCIQPHACLCQFNLIKYSKQVSIRLLCYFFYSISCPSFSNDTRRPFMNKFIHTVLYNSFWGLLLFLFIFIQWWKVLISIEKKFFFN